MLKILSNELLESLISQGYRYCLSMTTRVVGEDANICIILVPVKQAPEIKKFPGKFDAFFKIGKEPRQMALGVEETIILVDLGEITTTEKHN